MSVTEPLCCMCKEHLLIAQEPTTWSVSRLRKLLKAPKKIREELQVWLDSKIHGEVYLCGRCYSDLKFLTD